MAVEEIAITPIAGPLDATVTPPGSKSITNRALLLAAMAAGGSTIEGALFSDDTRQMVTALAQLGFQITAEEARGRIAIVGRGGTIPAAGANLSVGGAGTAMRFLAAFATLGHGRFRIDGNDRMRERPMGELLDTLTHLGAHAFSEHGNRCPPVIIERGPEPFAGGEAAIDASASSQFVSALLMPAPLWRDGLRLRVSGETARPFIDMTLRLMERRGARSSVTGDTLIVPGGQSYRAGSFAVEPDASAASYFAAAAALVGGTVRIRGLDPGSVQGDLAFMRVLEKMGAEVRFDQGAIAVSGRGRLSGVDVAMNTMPDMVPTLAALAPFASSPTRIRAVGFIRHHESDRLRALATELTRIGASVREFDDGLGIEPAAAPHPATIETYDDHRIAMAFAVAGLRLAGLRIRNPGCVAKTYPNFFEDLARLSRPIV
ncbi:MAG TPA: 3-phosphoshikimate 1-carboxyvinyltransferase [Candidatus Binataceae bacterium]|nr:3-phosphoshikimate 1-carboxyvinyltransferase [Candidatus Binataceae bacterium]HVB81704.1 3-phosphoshikimate 1-carboxyvinyltransferase [Candidatus Binataceae bacterium]